MEPSRAYCGGMPCAEKSKATVDMRPCVDDDGFVADVEEEEGAGAVGVLCAAGREASLADEGSGLVSQAAGYRHCLSGLVEARLP